MGEPLRILLVEDNGADADIIKELFKDTDIGHEITWLDDGEKAIKFFDDGGQTDIIIIDLNLPRVSGHGVIKFLKERGIGQTIPVIVLTGSDSPLDMASVEQNGVVCYLIKPMTIEDMDQMTKTLKEILLGQRSGNC